MASVLSANQSPRPLLPSKSLLPLIYLAVANSCYRDARGHAGRPMAPPKLRYFCAGMPEEPMVVYQVCPACFFR